ncbi:mechanosensitive ion channel [Devosia sp. YIM 151766]|uniref:mechanosensitive ion channel domain-containing protein n=1 Tax=Devosia sp. YIM 151766 TaxID=3017325 RepID=UPI00255CA740|nr:mechanosensitive ion channel domain-containing protein [Devosia sp. YIM 151766]WIY52487.1 mechanosensitive ion channel [Devosia sp. YIM 151766]
MRFLFLLLAALLFLAPAQAQQAASEPAPAEELIRILEDDNARADLIERLRQAAPEAVDDAAAEPAAPQLSIARQLAEYTRSVAEGASATMGSFGKALGNFQDVFTGGLNADGEVLRNLAINISIVIAGLFGSFFVLRLATHALTRRIAADAQGKGGMRWLGALLLVGLIDAASIVIAWGLGYVLALNTGVNPSGQMGINQSLLLNAFLVVEAGKLVFRLALAPRLPSLRPLPVSDESAAYWSFWTARLISLVGYAFLFVTPMLNGVVSRAAGSAVQVLAMATAITIAIIIVLQSKNDVRTWLAGISARRNNDGIGRALTALGQHWHVLAIAYLLTLLVVWFANPETALPFMLGASLQSLIAIAVGALIVAFIGRFVSAGLTLPDDVRQRLPLLETRLRAFVPGVMAVVRWVVIFGVLVAIGQAWALFDFAGWLSSEEGLLVAGSVVSAALILLVAIVLHVVVASWIEYRLSPKVGRVATAREKTLLNLFKNAFTVALAIFALMLALAQIGVNIAPLIAGAGVVGLAIGFGAQKLVQDIITGIFIQFENVMNEGDVVEAAGRSGTVEKLTIRSVTIRDMSGTIHLIPFSSVDQVSNMVRGFSFYVADVEVAYDNDIEAVKQAMRDAFEVVMQSEHKTVILDDLDPPVLVAFTQTSMKLRARIKTLAGQQWGAGRLYSETVWRLFAERHIRKPTPRVSYVPGLPAPWNADEGGD